MLLNILNVYEFVIIGDVNLFGKMLGKVGYFVEIVW